MTTPAPTPQTAPKTSVANPRRTRLHGTHSGDLDVPADLRRSSQR